MQAYTPYIEFELPYPKLVGSKNSVYTYYAGKIII